MKYLSLICLMLLASCSSPVELTGTESTYFPLKAGTFIEYRVDRTTYGIGEMPRSSKTTIRRSIDSSFVLVSDSVFLVNYSTKLAENVWRKDSSHAAWQKGSRCFEQENGQTIVKLHHPANEAQQWNINSFNALPEVVCTLKNINAALSLGSHYFDETVAVVRYDDSTLLSKKKYIETYAQNVGLVRREIQNVRYCQSDSCIGKYVIESGWTELVTLEKSGRK